MKRAALIVAAMMLMAAADPATETEHVVTEGETLSGIAERAGVSKSVIAAANGLNEPYDVQKGQRLIIPRQRVHTVKKGETGLGIANRYGIPFDMIAIANGMDKPYKVRTGQRLIIPAVLADAPPPPPQRSEPYFRVPHDGKQLLGYGRRADGGGHEGIDFAVKSGDMIRAASSGTVVFADKEPKRFGHLVVIDHGNGWRTRYGHLTRVTVKLGEVVKTGERIGIGGQGGNAKRPELHFEIIKDGTPVNPAGRLARN